MELPDLPDPRERLEGKGPREILHAARYLIYLSVVFLFALWIRLIPRGNMQYMQALDPYMISRMAEAIVTGGSLPLFDVWRYFPYTTPTHIMNLGDIFIPAYLYAIFSPFIDFVTWTQVYPALAGALMVIAMYFAGKEMFNRRAGLLAAFFLASAPAILHRSSAGWFEKEPFAGFLMITSIYFLTRAWKRKSWFSGIISGTALGISMTVWGGANFLLILYPITAFVTIILNEDVEKLIAAFTPTLIIGHFLAAILNPWRSSLPNGMFLAAVGVLGVIWVRYLVEKHGFVEGKAVKYVAPATSLLGGFLLFLSPLYSQSLASNMQKLISKIIQNPGGVVGGTVAENQPARAGEIIGQLGAFRASNVLPGGIAQFSEFFSGWTLSLIGTSVLMALVTGMLVKKYYGTEEVSARQAYAAVFVSLTSLIVALVAMLPGSAFSAFTFSFAVAILVLGLLLVAPREGSVNIETRWYLLIPLLWSLSTLYGATSKSRLLFLTAQPVALMAGYAVSTGIDEFRVSSVWKRIESQGAEVDPRRVMKAVLVLAMIPVIVFNASAAYGMAQGIGGSPNQLWMENLDFMREETPADSVVLSWWDYGYWFETIGARAAIADGGNLGFYTSGEKVNFPLADFLTSEDYTEHLDWLESHSVDYVVLDSSMIGKYSAVSQIHNRDNNQFNAMQTMSCRSQNNRCLTTNANNQTYLMYESRGTRVLVPFEQRGNSLAIDGTPLMQTQNGVVAVSNVCSEQGIREVDVPGDRSTLPGCISFHPFRQHQQIVYIPRPVMESTLAKLYVMDAPDMPHFEEVFDNGFVKMWKVDYSPSTAPS